MSPHFLRYFRIHAMDPALAFSVTKIGRFSPLQPILELVLGGLGSYIGAPHNNFNGNIAGAAPQ
jgi:hypothetical protein